MVFTRRLYVFFNSFFRHLAKSSLITAIQPLWYATCRIYIAHLQAHIDDLTERLSDIMQDSENVLSLRCSNIISLTTLAQIGHILSKGRPDVIAFRKQRNDSLRCVLLAVSELSLQDFKLKLDPFICVGLFLISCIRIKITRWATQIYFTHALGLFTQENTPSESGNATVLARAFDIVPLRPEIPASILGYDSDFEASVAKMVDLNDEYIHSRWLPGTMTLCEVLAAGDLWGEPAHAQNHGG